MTLRIQKKKGKIKMKAIIRNQLNTNKTERYDTCCFCGAKMLPEESHNPYPVKPYSFFTTEVVEGRCCSMCNQLIVMPARLEKLRRREY